MTSREWEQVREVFAAALRRDPEERGQFIDQACAGKPWLHAEVAALLAHVRSGETPSLEATARQPPDRQGDATEGRVVGPYILRQELGRGGMGVVYLADDTRLSRRVALKALAPGLSREVGGRERLRREARAAAALSHPGIATIYALEEIDGELYLVCEYVPGPVLRTLLLSGPLPMPQVVEIGAQLARALAAAHAQGVIHRDLKPENVVRTPSGIVKILDFGLARVESSAMTGLTQTGSILGTPAYMAPEQALGQPVDFRTDLFALGLLLYEMASGANPFVARTITATLARIVEVEPPPLSKVQPDCEPELDRIVATCLRKDPRERYTTTQAVVDDLDRLQAEIAAFRHQTPAGRRPEAFQPAPGSPGATPLWWWKFHQAAVLAVCTLMLYPAWRVRSWLPPPWGMLFLFCTLACAAAATSLRLHLLFTARFYIAELAEQQTRTHPWARLSDGGFAASLVLAALGVGSTHLEMAMLLVAVSTATVVSSFVIEPATTKAAFHASGILPPVKRS